MPSTLRSLLHPNARVLRTLTVAISISLALAASAPGADAATVSVVGGPGYWTTQTSASFRLWTSEPTDVECRLDAHQNGVAVWEVCVDGHTVPGPLAEGRHVLEVRAAGDAEAQGSWTWRVDATPPTIPTLFEPDGLWALERYISVSWGASDGYSGIAHYTLSYDRWTSRGVTESNVPWLTRNKATGASFLARPGSTYCLRATTQDRAGNPAPGWSADRCFALPLDDGALERSTGWIRRENTPDYFLDSYIQSKRQGSWARREVVARRVVLVATKCPSCGEIAVRWRGRIVKTVSLQATEIRRGELVPLVTFAQPTKGMIRIDVISGGKLVRVEGLGASAA